MPRGNISHVLALLCLAAAWVLPGVAAGADDSQARALVAAAIDLTRGTSSYANMTMLVHRPGWQRQSSLVAWTRGRTDALIRFTAPNRDAGNATLKQGERMWTFTPKLNRSIRLPYSLMSQSWAGSDFSYNDLSRTDQLLTDFQLTLLATEIRDGHQVHIIEAIPHDSAPVVWGKEVLELRDDAVLLAQTFFDQDMQPLKRLQATAVGSLGGRTMAIRMRMSKLDEPDHWTEVHYIDAQFDLSLPDNLFTLFALKNGATPATMGGTE